MIDPSPEELRKELGSLSDRLRAAREEFRERGMLSGAHLATLDRIQQEKDQLAVSLSDAERTGADWDRIKAEFGRSWNSFIVDLDLLELKLLDAQNTKKLKA
jgi:hypothetical protein